MNERSSIVETINGTLQKKILVIITMAGSQLINSQPHIQSLMEL